MSLYQRHILITIAFFICFGFGNGELRRGLRKSKNLPTIYVDQSGHGNFSTVQAAIDSIPSNNLNWICIYVKAGEYREQVIIPMEKSFIYLKGEGKRKTNVIWDAHDSMATSATFMSQANDIVVKSITFRNSYNNPPNNGNPTRAALAARIEGDRVAMYRCGFFGFQDTLWDVQGRHYFKLCTIQGAVDFIFGAGQSIYERSTLSVITRALGGIPGFITAQARDDPTDKNGFLFRDCNVVGDGPVFLGRPWRGYARVIFYNSTLSDIVVPEGWSAWGSAGHENQLTFAEYDCKGPGSNNLKRVKWEKKLNQEMNSWLTSMNFIDKEGWISNQPFNMLV